MSLSRIAVLGVLAIAVLAFAACGGDDAASSASPSASAAASASASASPGPSASPSASASPGSPSGTPAASASPSGTSTATAAGSTATSAGSATATATSAPGTSTGTVTPRGPLPTAAASYCDTIGPNSPPNSVLGILKIDGKDVPAGTPVQVAFDGIAGPAEYTRAAGGYRVDFGTSSTAGCPNKNGAKITVIVEGKTYDIGATVGSLPAVRFDIID